MVGNPNETIISCDQPEGYVDNAEDMNDPCLDEPYIQAYWALCSSVDLCSMDEYPIILMLDDEPVLLNPDYSFQWTNHTSEAQSVVNQNHFIIIQKGDSVSLEISFPDGCTYVLEFMDDCN